jgi:hypothetical protein
MELAQVPGMRITMFSSAVAAANGSSRPTSALSVPTNKPQPDVTLKALARAWRWQGVLDGCNGTSGDVRVPR